MTLIKSKKSNQKKQYEQAIDGNSANCSESQIKLASGEVRLMSNHFFVSYGSPECLVVRALRCHRSNPGSTTGLDKYLFAKQISGRESTHTDKRKTTDASQIHEKVTQQKEVPFDFRQNLPCCRTNVIKTSAGNIRPKRNQFLASSFGPDIVVVRKFRCGRSSPGSNPGLDR